MVISLKIFLFKRWGKLYKVTKKWDMSKEEIEEKKKILYSWHKKVSFNEKKIIYNICDNIHYYSANKSSDTLKKIEMMVFNSNDMEYSKTLFLPLKKKERMESSLPIFSTYIVKSRLRDNNPNNIVVDYSKDYIKRFVEKKNRIHEYFKNYDQLHNENMVHNSELQIAEGIDRKKPKHRIKINTREMGKINKELQTITALDEYTVFNIENIVFIDDFIGTGNSIETFIKEISTDLINLNDELNLNIYFFVLECSKNAEKRLNNFLKNSNIPNNIKVYIKYGSIAIDFANDTNIYKNTRINNPKKIIEEVNNRFSIHEHKYSENMGVASFVNVPNNNVGLITQGSKKWEPLFPRTAVARVDNKKAVKDHLILMRNKL